MSGRRRRSSRSPVAVLITLVAMTVAAGCGGPGPPGPLPTTAGSGTPTDAPATPTDAPPEASPTQVADLPADLLLLSGRPGAMGLELVSANGQRRSLPLPDPDVAWISTDAAGHILGTTRAGLAFLSESMTTLHTPAWRALAPTLPGTGALPGPLSFGTLDPDGSRAAFVAADYATNRPFAVVIVDAATDATSVVPIPRPAEGAPPAWVDGRLVLLTRERGDEPGVTILDPTDGSLTDGPGPAREAGPAEPSGTWTGRIAALALSGDGSTVAVGNTVDDRIEIGPAGPWLARRPTELTPVPLEPGPGGGRSFAWLALSPSGDRLAIVRTDADGDAVDVTVHSGRDGWRAGPPISLPGGATRAVVAWLP